MKTRDDLREAQRTIVGDLLDANDRIIVAGMGGGKTGASLTAASDLLNLDVIRGGIVLAPPIPAAQVWPREGAKWEHLQHLTVEFLDGSPAARKKRLLSSEADLLVVSIYQTKWLAGVLETLPEDHRLFGLILVDEISRFRGPRSKLARALEPVLPRFQNRWGLTGTIRPNGYEDLFKPYEFISNGDVWNGTKFDDWRRQNFMPLDYKGYNWKVHSFAAKEIDARIALWTTSVNVELGLPPLNAGDDFDIEVDLAEDARKAYDEMLKEFAVQPDPDPATWITAESSAIQSGKLSQLTQGFVYAYEAEEDEERTRVVAAEYENAKLAALSEFLLDHPEENVLICYQYHQDLKSLLGLLGPNTPYIGAGVNPHKRIDLVDDFSRGNINQLLVHPASMGHGVDGLQHGGRLIIWYSLTWSGEQYDQTVKRLDRPGQTRPVFSRRIVARGTVDYLKRVRVENKGDLQEAWNRMMAERGFA